MQNQIEKMGSIQKNLQQAFKEGDAKEKGHPKQELQKDFGAMQDAENHNVSKELQEHVTSWRVCQDDLVLEEVAPDRQLVVEMEKYLPHSYQVMSMVLLHLRYQHFPLIDAKVYTPRCALYRYKMVIIKNIASNDDLQSMSLYWMKDHLSDGAVYHLLRSLPGVNWEQPILIRQIPIELHHNMDLIIDKLSNNVQVTQFALPLIIFVWRNSAPDVPSLPAGYYMAPLTEVHGQKVLTGWVGSFTEKQEVFSQILDHLPAVGVFKKHKLSSETGGAPGTANGIQNGQNISTGKEANLGSTTAQITNGKNFVDSKLAQSDYSTGKLGDSASGLPSSNTKGINGVDTPEKIAVESGDCLRAIDNGINGVDNPEKVVESADELVSWVLLKHGADIGMTYTTKPHRSLGLAKTATLELVRQALKEKVNAFILTTEDNKVSIAMHTKLGFEKYSTDMILMYTSKDYSVDHIEETVRCCGPSSRVTRVVS